MRNFYSGISNDRMQFLINMNWYDKNDFELVYLKFKWVGNTYYPQESDKSEGEPIRVYRINA